MFPPLVGLSGVFDAAGFWQNLATMLGTAAVWAQQRAHKPEPNEYEKLEQMIRQPVAWTMRHPIVALKRRADRRRRSI